MKLGSILILAMTALPCMAHAQTFSGKMPEGVKAAPVTAISTGTTQESIPSALCGKDYCSGALFNGGTLIGEVSFDVKASSLGQFDANGQNGLYVHVAADGSFPAVGPYPAGRLVESYYTVKHQEGRYGYVLTTYMTGTITVE